MNALLQDKDWEGHKTLQVVVTREGSATGTYIYWSGEIIIWRKDDYNQGARNEGGCNDDWGCEGDWQAGDVIQLMSCTGK